MPLTTPDTEDLRFHMRQGEQFSTLEAEYAEDSIQRATDLMEVAIGIHEDPADELGLRIMTMGILSMAHAIYVGSEDREALYSPFSSERLGSYNYSKMVQAVEDKGMTGVPEFDQAVRYFAGIDQADPDSETAIFGLSSEQVWTQPYTGSEETDTLRDPVAPLASDAWNQ